MSSRLFKHQMASTNKAPSYPVLSAGVQVAPFLYTWRYSKETDTFVSTEAPNIFIDTVTSTAYSKDGKFVLYGSPSTPYLALYRRNGGALTRLPLTVSATGDTTDIKFSNDGLYLITCHYTMTPYFQLYKRNVNGESYDKLTTGLPTVTRAYSGAFSPDNQYLAIGNESISIFKRNGDSFSTVLAKPTSYVNSSHKGLAWSKDGTILFGMSAEWSMPLTAYKRTGDSFANMATAAALTSSNSPLSMAVSPDETHIALGIAGSPFYAIFKWNGTTFTRLTGLPAIPSHTNDLSYSEDGQYLALSHNNTVANGTRLTVLKRTGDIYTALPSPVLNAASGGGMGAAFGPKS